MVIQGGKWWPDNSNELEGALSHWRVRWDIGYGIGGWEGLGGKPWQIHRTVMCYDESSTVMGELDNFGGYLTFSVYPPSPGVCIWCCRSMSTSFREVSGGASADEQTVHNPISPHTLLVVLPTTTTTIPSSCSLTEPIELDVSCSLPRLQAFR